MLRTSCRSCFRSTCTETHLLLLLRLPSAIRKQSDRWEFRSSELDPCAVPLSLCPEREFRGFNRLLLGVSRLLINENVKELMTQVNFIENKIKKEKGNQGCEHGKRESFEKEDEIVSEWFVLFPYCSSNKWKTFSFKDSPASRTVSLRNQQKWRKKR